jgi:hypothetical protein
VSSQVSCPHCGQVLGVPQAAPDAKLQCPACETFFRLQAVALDAAGKPESAGPTRLPRVKKKKKKRAPEEGECMPGAVIAAIAVLVFCLLARLGLVYVSPLHEQQKFHPALNLLTIVLIGLALVGLIYRHPLAWGYCRTFIPAIAAIRIFCGLLLLPFWDEEDLPFSKAMIWSDLLLDVIPLSLAFLLRTYEAERYYEYDGPTVFPGVGKLPDWTPLAILVFLGLVIAGYFAFGAGGGTSRHYVVVENGRRRPMTAEERKQVDERAAKTRAEFAESARKRKEEQLAKNRAFAEAPPPLPPAPAELDQWPQLVGHWRFDEGAGKKVKDSSPQGWHGEMVDAEWVAGRHGRALRFNGTSSYVKLPSQPLRFEVQDGLTVALWFRPKSGRGVMLSMNSVGGMAWPDKVDLQMTVSRVRGEVNSQGRFPLLLNVQWPTAGAPEIDLQDGAWHHAALVRKGSGELELFIDGRTRAKVGAHVEPGPIETHHHAIGAELSRTNVGVYCFDGDLDEVFIFRRALTAQEIARLAGVEAKP